MFSDANIFLEASNVESSTNTFREYFIIKLSGCVSIFKTTNQKFIKTNKYS